MKFAAAVAAAFAIFAVAAVAHAESPWIGIELDRGAHGGSKVKRVLENTPAERAGLRPGDEVLAVDKVAADSPRALIGYIQKAGIGRVVKLRVVDEKGAERTVALKLEPKPDMDTLQQQLLDKPAPDVNLAVQVGAKLGKLSSLRGRVVLIDFFATWCMPCREEMPQLEALAREHAADGLQVVGVSGESPPIVAGAAGKFHVSYPLASDEGDEASGRYFVTALPTMVVIDRQGVVRKIVVGDLDSVRTTVLAALKAP